MVNKLNVLPDVGSSSSLNQIELQQLNYSINVKQRLAYTEPNFDITYPQSIREQFNAIATISNDTITPISLIISSYGGEIYGMLGILDIFKQMPMPIHTVGIGAVMSAATMVLAAGEKGHRKIGRNTQVMIHQLSTWLEGTSGNILNEANQIRSLQQLLNEILAEHSNQNKSFWAKKASKNLYLTPQQCVDYGLADVII